MPPFTREFYVHFDHVAGGPFSTTVRPPFALPVIQRRNLIADDEEVTNAVEQLEEGDRQIRDGIETCKGVHLSCHPAYTQAPAMQIMCACCAYAVKIIDLPKELQCYIFSDAVLSVSMPGRKPEYILFDVIGMMLQGSIRNQVMNNSSLQLFFGSVYSI